jgi:ubiquinone biosynthesis protein COQ4
MQIARESSWHDEIWQALPVPGADPAHPAFVHVPPPPPLPRRRWRRALRSIRELVAQTDAPDKAIEVFYAISLGAFEGWFQRFLADPAGRALAAERPDLGAILCDAKALGAMPRGSFGEAFAAFVARNGIEPQGVFEANRKAQRAVGCPALDPLRGWFRDRLIFSHDLGHVLSGYETDGPGETRLLAFALAQYGGRAYEMVTLAAGLENWRGQGRGWPLELARAWRLGRRARWVPALPLEQLLPLPLEDVRRAAGLTR